MPERQLLNPVALAELKDFGGDPLVLKLLGLYFEHVPGMVAQLVEAYDGGDFKLLKRTAHTLKSSTASLGAERLFDLVAQIEEAAAEENIALLEGLVPSIESIFQQTQTLLEAWS